MFGKRGRPKKEEPRPTAAEPTPILDTGSANNDPVKEVEEAKVNQALKELVEYYKKNYQGVFNGEVLSPLTQNDIQGEMLNLLLSILSEVKYLRYEVVKELEALRETVKEE